MAAADDAEGVEAGVAEEAAVLDGQHRLDEVLGQLLVAHQPPLLAALVEEVGDQLGLQRLRAGTRFLMRSPRISLTRSFSKATSMGSSAASGRAREEDDDLVATTNSPGAAGMSVFCSYFSPFRVFTRVADGDAAGPGRSTSGRA